MTAFQPSRGNVVEASEFSLSPLSSQGVNVGDGEEKKSLFRASEG